MSNIINSNFKKYLLVDIYDMILKDKSTGEVILSDTLTSCGLDCSTSPTTVQGGKGNVVIATLSSSKEIKVTTEAPTFNLDLIARQMGTDIVKTAGKTMKIEEVTLDSSKQANLSCTPSGEVKCYTEKGVVTGTASAKKLTCSTCAEGDVVKVIYETVTSSNTEVIEINANNFPKAMEMYLTTILIDSEQNIVADVTYHFPSVVMSADFSQSTSSERNANSQSYTFTVLGTSANLGTLEVSARGEE